MTLAKPQWRIINGVHTYDLTSFFSSQLGFRLVEIYHYGVQRSLELRSVCNDQML